VLQSPGEEEGIELLTVTSGGCSPAQPFQHQAAMVASGAAFPAAVCGKHARNIVIGEL
jgi:hypothetical protein